MACRSVGPRRTDSRRMYVHGTRIIAGFRAAPGKGRPTTPSRSRGSSDRTLPATRASTFGQRRRH